MKKLFYTGIMLTAFSFASAQTEQKQLMSTAPQKDTTTVNRQLQKESDLKTMDAVKTQDHEKPVPKAKANDTSKTRKDATKVKRHAQK